MKRRLKLNLAIILFLCFAILAAAFILTKDQGNSFQIERSSGPADSAKNDSRTDEVQPSGTAPAGNAGEEETAAAQEEIDWTPLIEKYRGQEISRIKTAEKKIALTFDAGANADGVDKVLSILDENNIRGTFFLTGKFIEKYPEKVKALIASGGDIGNHTYDHKYLTQLTPDQIREEIEKAEGALSDLAPETKFKPFLRPPYGSRTQTTKDAISDNGYISIQWTVDSLGWKGTSGGQSKETVRDKVLKNSAPGAIIMMHLGSNPDDKTHLDSEALPEIIGRLRADGYEFVTLSELIRMGQ